MGETGTPKGVHDILWKIKAAYITPHLEMSFYRYYTGCKWMFIPKICDFMGLSHPQVGLFAGRATSWDA